MKALKKVNEKTFLISHFSFLISSSYLCSAFGEKSFEIRAFSSAGLEHLPYKQRVGGSNPSTPTKRL